MATNHPKTTIKPAIRRAAATSHAAMARAATITIVARAAAVTIVEVMVVVRALLLVAEHALVIKIIVIILALHPRLAMSQEQAQPRPGHATRSHGKHTRAVLGPAPLVVR